MTQTRAQAQMFAGKEVPLPPTIHAELAQERALLKTHCAVKTDSGTVAYIPREMVPWRNAAARFTSHMETAQAWVDRFEGKSVEIALQNGQNLKLNIGHGDIDSRHSALVFARAQIGNAERAWTRVGAVPSWAVERRDALVARIGALEAANGLGGFSAFAARTIANWQLNGAKADAEKATCQRFNRMTLAPVSAADALAHARARVAQMRERGTDTRSPDARPLSQRFAVAGARSAVNKIEVATYAA